MSVVFLGRTHHLNLSNGTAEKLLAAIGCTTAQETAGSMPIRDARLGIQAAKAAWERPVHIDFLRALEDILDELSDAAAETLEWC